MESAERKMRKGAVVKGDDILRRDDAEEIDGFAIAGEKQKMQRSVGILLLEASEHGIGEDHGAHLRK